MPDDYGNPAETPEWMQVDWHQHLQRVQAPGAEVNYVDIGEGPVLLFVHGLSGCWQNWLENLPQLSRAHRCLALDLPGFGDSAMPSWTIDMPAYGRLLHDFCEKLGVDRVAAVIGNSMGGFVSTEAAVAQPERFERLVLVSAAGISNARARNEPAAVAARLSQYTGPLLARFTDAAIVRPRGRYVAFRGVARFPDRLRPELLWEQLEPGTRSPGFGDALKALVGYDTRDSLSEIEVPTLIVWGFNDRIVPVQSALSYHRRIRGSQLEIFERTGHVPMLERPARFNRVVEEFLAGAHDSG